MSKAEKEEEGTPTEVNKTPRLPRWTRQEILILIQGKRVAESQGRRGIGPGQVAEPKWASVSAYCKRHGVDRGPVQCRKRWSNLFSDYKRIKEWESTLTDETDSFWLMRNDLRRLRRLPGFFDRHVYDVLHPAEQSPMPETEEIVFDSGTTAVAENGLFSEEPRPITATVVSDKEYEPTPESCHGQGTNGEKQPATNPEGGSASPEGRKRKLFTSDGDRDEDENEDEDAISLQNQLIDVLERNGKMLATQLEAQNTNFQLDWEQRKDLAFGLVSVLNKLADAIVKVADKL